MDYEHTEYRNYWSFDYKCGDLIEAVERKVAHHASRYEFWKTELLKAETALKEKGVEFREEVGMSSYKTDNKFTDIRVVVDPERQKRVAECKQKLREHGELVETYKSYIRAFTLNRSVNVKLTVRDINFFGL